MLTDPVAQDPKVKRDCWECEINVSSPIPGTVVPLVRATDKMTQCLDCIADTQRMCKHCGGGYCIVHHEGSTQTLCDCAYIIQLHLSPL